MSELERNIDAEEIAHFDEVAGDWWNLKGPYRTLHEFNPFRIDFIASVRTLRGARALDVGCGGGILSEGLAARGASVTGLDVSRKLLEVAREHAAARGRGIEYVEGTVEEFAESGQEGFDLITCIELIEHVPDPASVIDACARLLGPGGDLILSSINRTPKAYLVAIVGAEHLLHLLPRGTHQYERFVRPSEASRWLRASGLDICEIAGFTYSPLTNRFRRTSRSDVNYFIHARRSC